MQNIKNVLLIEQEKLITQFLKNHVFLCSLVLLCLLAVFYLVIMA